MSFKAFGSRIGGSSWFGPAVVAMCAWVAVVAALDPAGDHPGSFTGPGMTVDEGFNVGQGVQLADRLLAFDLPKFREIDAQLPDHPPLGRLTIGLCHELAFLVWPPVDRSVPYSITCARIAPACAFALLIVLIGNFASRCYGQVAGIGGAAAVAMMPRTFGHAHLAALESMVNLSTAAVVLYMASRWGGAENIGGEAAQSEKQKSSGFFSTWKTEIIGGILFGLALLTKVQAVLLPVPIALWIVWRRRTKGIVSLALWGAIGLGIFIALWPHLWEAPVDHLLKYLGRTTNRSIIWVWYFGESIADREVAWHYPWVMFLTTVPIGLHALGFYGCFAREKSQSRLPGEWLVLGCILFPLVLFSVPGIAVYDGERLFSFVFPLWGVFIGRGAAIAWNRIHDRFSQRIFAQRIAAACGVCFFAAQMYGLWNYAPAWLSYYNGAVGGLAGANRVGLEVSYWGDGVTRNLLAAAAQQAPRGSVVAVLPTLHPAQWREVEIQSPPLKERGVRLETWGTDAAKNAQFLLVFNRPEYLPEELRRVWDERRIVAAERRAGVILAALLRVEPENSSEKP